MDPLITIGRVVVRRDGLSFVFEAGAAIDGDGSPRAYAPPHSGLSPLDHIANAGKEGDWFGLVCVGGSPVIQGASDPAPGYYVSPTALADPSKALSDPRRYVDSEQVPYISVPPQLRTLGVHLGDFAEVTRGSCSVACIVADVGPRSRIGEISIAAAKALGIPSSPRNGGVEAGISYRIWPGTSKGWPVTDIAVELAALQEVTSC